MLSCFSLIAIDLHGTLGSWFGWSGLCYSFKVFIIRSLFQMSPEEYQTYLLPLLYINFLYHF